MNNNFAFLIILQIKLILKKKNLEMNIEKIKALINILSVKHFRSYTVK